MSNETAWITWNFEIACLGYLPMRYNHLKPKFLGHLFNDIIDFYGQPKCKVIFYNKLTIISHFCECYKSLLGTFDQNNSPWQKHLKIN